MWYRKYYKLAVWILCIAAPIFGFCTQRKTKYRSVCELTPNFVQSHNFLTTFWQLFYRKMSQNEPSEKHKKNPWKRLFISIFKDFCVGGDMGKNFRHILSVFMSFLTYCKRRCYRIYEGFCYFVGLTEIRRFFENRVKIVYGFI